jgi:AcrR family transcriptional regulator
LILAPNEYRFIAVNLDSPKRRAAASATRSQARRPAGRAPRAPQVRALKTQLREAVRAQILDAAEELIAARGLHGAGLAQIARNAGVAVGTLYNYFDDRDAMIRALFESRRGTMRPKLLAAATNAEKLKFEPRLRQFVRAMLVAFEEHRRFVKVAHETEYSKVAPSTLAADMMSAIEMMVKAGVVERTIDETIAPLLVLVIAGALKSVIVKRTMDGTEFAKDADTLVSIILDGARRR